MRDQAKTKPQLIEELGRLREQLAACAGAGKDPPGPLGDAGPEGSMWRSLVRNTPLFILILDEDCTIRFANRTDSGASPDRIIGKRLDDFCPAENREKVRECVRQVFRTGEPRVLEGPAIRLDGEEHWYATHFAPVEEEGRVVAVSAISVNITDRKRAEGELREQRNRTQQYLDVAGAILLVLDNLGNVLLLNRKGYATLGYGEGDLLGKNWFDSCLPPRMRDEVKLVFQELIAGRMTAREYHESPVVTRSGEERILAWHNAVLRDDAGLIVGTLSSGLDVTERSRAEEALRRAWSALEEKVKDRTADFQKANEELDIFRRFAESSEQGFGMADMDGRITYMNAALCRLAGVATPEDALGKHLSRFYPEGYMLKRETEILPALLAAGHWEGDLMVAPEGKTRHILQNSFLIKDEKGCPSRLGSVITDITDRQRAEAALRQSHDELQAIYDGMADGLLIADRDTKRFVRTNPAICAMLGYSEEELLARSVMDIHPAGQLEQVLATFQANAEGRLWVAESIPVRRRDGSIFYADIATNQFRYQDRPCVIGFFRDITERKRAEEALLQSHDELRAIYESIEEGLLVADGQTRRFVRANPAICSMLGYSEEELLTLSIADLHPKEVVADLLRPLETKVSPHLPAKSDVPMLKRDGKVFYADISGNTFTYQGRRCSLGVFRDVSERRQAQEALERERRTLEHLLRASDHERQLIAYDIHDGLAQELAGAIMQFQVFEQFKDARPEDARKAYDGGITLLRQGYSEARRLISGVRPPILDESGVMAAISHLIHDPAFEQGPRIEFRSRVKFNRLDPVVENVIYRIVQEGLSNARNHSRSPTVGVSLMQRGDRLRIEIRDRGVGFDPKQVAENRFGLDGIRERARLLGGKCSVKSKPGEGTSVVVELPVVERQVDP